MGGGGGGARKGGMRCSQGNEDKDKWMKREGWRMRRRRKIKDNAEREENAEIEGTFDRRETKGGIKNVQGKHKC